MYVHLYGPCFFLPLPFLRRCGIQVWATFESDSLLVANSVNPLALLSHEWVLCNNLNVVLMSLFKMSLILLLMFVAVSVVHFISLASAQKFRNV